MTAVEESSQSLRSTYHASYDTTFTIVVNASGELDARQREVAQGGKNIQRSLQSLPFDRVDIRHTMLDIQRLQRPTSRSSLSCLSSKSSPVNLAEIRRSRKRPQKLSQVDSSIKGNRQRPETRRVMQEILK